MSQDAVIARAIQGLLGDVIEQSARDQGADQRRGSKLSGGAFARTLMLGFLHQPQATLDDLAQTAALVAEPVSPQAIDQRFTLRAADHLKMCLETAVRQVIKAERAASTALFDRFSEVCVQDSTSIQLPDEFASQYRGCGGCAPTVALSALKFQVRFELKRGGLQGFRIEEGRSSDATTPLQTQDIVAGSLHLRDLGYFDLAVFRAIEGEKAFYLSRLHRTAAVFDAAGQRLVVSHYLMRQRRRVVEATVTVGVAERMPGRMIAVRIPRALRHQRRQDQRRQARKKGYRLSKEQLALCVWNIYITNLPPTLLTVAEAVALLRMRWQIELLFKQWKSVGGLDESRSRKPERVLCELFAKMLALVIQHWILITSCWQYPNRSLSRASQAVRRLAGSLAAAWRSIGQIAEIVRQIARILQRTARVDRRRKQPSAFQVIDNPTQYGYKL